MTVAIQRKRAYHDRYQEQMSFLPPTRWPSLTFLRGKKKKATRGKSMPTDLNPYAASMIDFSQYDASMQKAIDALQVRYTRMRASGASPGMLDDIRVDAYGSSASLNKLAQVSVRDGRTLTVNVFDESTSVAVERAIRAAGLNLNPVPDGPAKLKVPIPKPTEKARQDLTKTALQDAESAKVATRIVRKKAMDAVKSLKDEVEKDDLKRMENSVQKMSDKYIAMIHKSLEEKVKSINIPG